MTDKIKKVSDFDGEIIDGITIYIGNQIELRQQVGSMHYNNIQVWKPYLIAFAKKCNMKTIFIGDGTVFAPDIKDTLFIYTKPRNIRFSTAYDTQITSRIELTSEQCTMFWDSDLPYSVRHVINIEDCDHDTLGCLYPVQNQLYLCNLVASTRPIAILDYIEKMITTGFDITIPHNREEQYKMTATINVIDNTAVSASVTKKLKTITHIYEEKFQQMKIDLNNAILNIKNTNRNIPEWVINSNLNIFFIGDEINRYLTIARKSSFKVTDIISLYNGNFKVTNLTRPHTVWIAITVKSNNKICEVALYNSTLSKSFNYIHRNASDYERGISTLCLGTFKSRLYNMTLNSVDDYYNAIDIIQEMLTTINLDDTTGSSRNMQNESNLINRIRDEDKTMNTFKYKTGGWTINDKNNIETDTTGGVWTTNETIDNDVEGRVRTVQEVLDAENERRDAQNNQQTVRRNYEQHARDVEERREQQELENEEDEARREEALERLRRQATTTTASSSSR